VTVQNVTLAFEASSWSLLLDGLNQDLETAWLLTARLVTTDNSDEVTLLVRAVVAVPDQDYVDRESDRLTIRSQGWVPAFGQANDDGSLPIFVHTHPRGTPKPSSHDSHVDDELAKVAEVRTELGHYASLVLSGDSTNPSFSGRLKLANLDWFSIDRIRIVGERLTVLSAWSESEPQETIGIFDRQVRAFGNDGQKMLRRLKVGVVGAGGTGSAVIEQLTRLGVGRLVIVDPDTLSDTNVTRVYGSTMDDIDAPKVDIARRHIDRIGLGTDVATRQGVILEKAVAEELVHCDIIFGCTDDNAGRILLGRMPQALLQLLVDCGVRIDSRAEKLNEIYGRVSIVTPTSACLVCMEEINQERANAELLTEAEYEERVKEGYAPELKTPDPAVVTFTTSTSAFAVNEMLSRLLGYSEEAPANRVLLRMADRSTSKSRRDIRGRHRCGQRALLASGLQAPLLDWGWQR
jgi:molybdopterin/thiamine biosynthesis adenylyltransferase